MLLLRPINFVPESVRLKNNLIKVGKVAKRYMNCVSCVLGILLLIEIIGIAWFSSVIVPNELESEYLLAQSEMEVIQKEFLVIDKSTVEDQCPLVAFSAILLDKPAEIGFTRIEIGKTDNQKGKSWVSFDGVAANPVVFRDFTSKLNGNKLFTGAMVEKISTNSQDNSKIATIRVEKK